MGFITGVKTTEATLFHLEYVEFYLYAHYTLRFHGEVLKYRDNISLRIHWSYEVI
jgi:hypothetical protein